MDTHHISPAAMRIVRQLVGKPPHTIAELMASTGVTRTAIMEQLNELTAAGLVQRSMERLSTRGRPRHRYCLTPAALQQLFSGNQHLLVPAIFQAIRELGGDALRRKVIKRVARILSDHYAKQLDAAEPAERLVQFCRVLEQEGGVVELVDSANGSNILRKRNCAFISMFEPARTVCAIDREVLSLLLGTSVEQTSSRHEGAPCCEFRIDSTGSL